MPQPCRFCAAPLTFQACDLGPQPLANNLVPMDAPDAPDPCFPLKVMVCQSCLLAQLEQTADPSAMFSDYSYRSSVSAVWRDHAARFAAMATRRFGLTPHSLVVEAGSNDGVLLAAFQSHRVRCLGIDPAANLAAEANRRGIPTITAFFNEPTAKTLARDRQKADLLVANNVLAHAPNLIDFVQGFATLLAPQGVLSIEVPHVLAMLHDAQFDTIYHEHVFYFSATVLRKVLAKAGLAIFDIERLPTHGGSLRLFAQHAHTGRQQITPAADEIIAAEQAAGLDRPERYRVLAEQAAQVSAGLRTFLDQARRNGETVAAYGAAAKGTMQLNAASATQADILFVADANPGKQGHRLPGCRIPIARPDQLLPARPDYLLVLPWNIAAEVMQATSVIATWGGRHVVASPRLRVIPECT